MEEMQDRLECIESALYYAREAIDNLECVDDCEDIIEAIRDKVRELTAERDTIHASIEAMQDAELEAARDEYWRDVL